MNISDEKMLKVLKRKVFTYDSSAADEVFFKNRIAEFFKTLNSVPSINNPSSWHHHEYGNFKDFVFKLVWERNGGGHTDKYIFFNEETQKVYLDRPFYEWAKLVGNMIYQELQKGQMVNVSKQ